jgi:hypothetical protein
MVLRILYPKPERIIFGIGEQYARHDWEWGLFLHGPFGSDLLNRIFSGAKTMD